MFHNQNWLSKLMIRIRNYELCPLRPLWFLALLLTLTLASVPAAAQYNAYVAQNASNSVWVINTMTDRVVAVIPVQFSPFGIAITPNGAFAYVSNTGAICDLCPIAQSGSVSVIDTTTYNVVATIPVGRWPAGVAFTPDGAFSYVANFNSNTVSVINTVTNTVTATIGVGTEPLFVAITPNGAFAYVTNYASNNVSVIQTATNGVVATVPMASNPWGVAITPNGSLAYVTNPRSNVVSVIDIGGAVPSVLATVRVGCGPSGAAITPNGAFTNVSNACDSTVSVINTATKAVVATVAVGPDPENIAISPDGFFAYTSNFMTGSLRSEEHTSELQSRENHVCRLLL